MAETLTRDWSSRRARCGGGLEGNASCGLRNRRTAACTAVTPWVRRRVHVRARRSATSPSRSSPRRADAWELAAQLAAVTRERDTRSSRALPRAEGPRHAGRCAPGTRSPRCVTACSRRQSATARGRGRVAQRVTRERDVALGRSARCRRARRPVWRGDGLRAGRMPGHGRGARGGCGGELERCDDVITARFVDAVREVRRRPTAAPAPSGTPRLRCRDAIEAVRDMIREGASDGHRRRD